MDRSAILPAGVLDASHATDSIILAGWVLDRPIEPKKVEQAWVALVAAWPILVSRLRKAPETGRWEYHLPIDTHSSTGARGFAALVVPGSIHDRYNYSKPSKHIRCTFKENHLDLFSPKGPKSIDELLTRDMPLTHLHVTLFDDAALVGLSVPHILCDGHGVKAIIRALTRILDGEAPPPPPPIGDPFKRYANAPDSIEAPPSWRVATTLQMLISLAYVFWNWLWNGNIENREVFFPKDEVERIKRDAMTDLRKEYGESTALWVSSSDALLAFCLKCTHPPTKSSTPLNVFYTANLRRLLRDVLPENFLHNSVCMVVTPTLPLAAVSTLSLGSLALHIRRTLDSQTTLPAVERWLKWHIANTGRKKVFFEPTGAWDIVTNWRDMALMRLDFSGALPTDSKATEVRCVYLWGNGIQPIPLRNWIGLWADDPNGGVWTSAFLPKKIWENKEGFGKFIEVT